VRSTAFLFSSGRRERLQDGRPTEFLYGYAELARDDQPVAMFEEEDLGAKRTWPWLFEVISARIAGVSGVSPRLAMSLVSALRGPLASYEVLIATTQSIGMALAALKAIGLHDKRIVVMTMGLLESDAADWRRAIHRRLLRGTTIAALSKPEAQSVRSWAGDRIDICDFTFGVDLAFWSPADTLARSDEILSIGNDRARDYSTLLAAWRPTFPRLTIITSLPISCDLPNVAIERGDWRGAAISDSDLRSRFQHARFIVTPLLDTLQPSGQSATLQAMACGRPVIISSNSGLWDPELMRSGICRLVPPGDSGALRSAIEDMIAHPEAAESMGVAAREALLANDISAGAMARQIVRLAR
jgi:glycosyltransferase involved in cell wall biosynthesis